MASRIISRLATGVCSTALAAAALAGAAAPASAQASASADTSASRFDALGRVTGTISADPDGPGGLGHLAVRNTFDPAGRLTRVERGTLASWQSEAVAPANWTGFTVHQTLDTLYDAMGRKLRETLSGTASSGSGAPSGVQGVTQYSYDALGRLDCTAVRMDSADFGANAASACHQDPTPNTSLGPDRIVRSAYDAAGQVFQVIEAVGTPAEAVTVTNSYTPNGQRAWLRDGELNRTTFDHDGHDRLLRTRFPVATFGADTSSSGDFEEYGYDANGNRTRLRKRDGREILFSYDALNRLSLKDVPGTAGDVVYDYDLRNLQTNARFLATSESVLSDHDGAGRLVSSRTTMGGILRTLSFELDRNGNRTRLTHHDGASFGFGYDGLNRMTIAHEGTLSHVDDYVVRYYYDQPGRRWVTVRGAGSGGTSTAHYYDGAGRLSVLAHDPPGTANDFPISMTYSPAGQIVSRTQPNDAYAFVPTAGELRNEAPNGLNQLVNVNGTQLQFDANGNMTSDGATTFTYDVENRLITASGARNATLTYDPLGRLDTIASGGTTTRFLYDGDRLVAEIDASNNVIRRYLHGPGVDEPVAVYEGAGLGLTNRRYPHADERGSVIALFNADGTLSAINRYDEYGVLASTNIGRFQYTGQLWLPEVQLLYYKARLYNPVVGARFLQVDPVGFESGMNAYAYANGDPINFIDPTGTIPLAACAVPPVTVVCVGVAEKTVETLLIIGCALFCDDAIEAASAPLRNNRHDEDNQGSPDRQGARRERRDEDPNRRGPESNPRAAGSDTTRHGQQRQEQARAGDRTRQVGDANRVIREGRRFRDTQTGARVYVQGDRVVVVGRGGRMTQFVNPRANTNTRIRSGRWVPE